MGLIFLKIVEGADSLTTSQQKRFQRKHRIFTTIDEVFLSFPFLNMTFMSRK